MSFIPLNERPAKMIKVCSEVDELVDVGPLLIRDIDSSWSGDERVWRNFGFRKTELSFYNGSFSSLSIARRSPSPLPLRATLLAFKPALALAISAPSRKPHRALRATLKTP